METPQGPRHPPFLEVSFAMYRLNMFWSAVRAPDVTRALKMLGVLLHGLSVLPWPVGHIAPVKLLASFMPPLPPVRPPRHANTTGQHSSTVIATC